jgi:hypothetical protein
MYRVMSYGDSSYFRDTEASAKEAAAAVLLRNGCGHIEKRMPNGRWQVISRFEPWTGIVTAS